MSQKNVDTVELSQLEPGEVSKKLVTPQTLDVVLVNSKSPTRPAKPDALAQANLDGGGLAGDLANRLSAILKSFLEDHQFALGGLELGFFGEVAGSTPALAGKSNKEKCVLQAEEQPCQRPREKKKEHNNKTKKSTLVFPYSLFFVL